MQSTYSGEVNGFETGEPKELANTLSERIDNGKADGGVIAKMPKKGREVEINGLKFRVQQITKSGNVILEPKGK